MAVGQPETNLDTWGLRYVKKISGSKTPSTKPTESTSAGNRISDADTETPDAFRGRQEDSKGDKDVKIHSATDKPSTSPQVHTAPTNVKPKEGEEGEGKYGVGSSVPAGSTQGDQKTPKLTARGDKKFTEAGGIHSGSDASNVSGIQSQTQQTVSEKNPHGVNRFGTPNKKNPEDKKQPKSGLPDTTQRSPKHENPVPTGGGAPKIKAEMALAIIKCKLLKMKTKKKDFIEEGRPTRPAYRKDDDEEEEKVEKGTKDYGSDNSGSAQIVDTGDGKPTASKQSVELSTSPSKDREDEGITSYGVGNSGDPKTSTGKPSMTGGNPYHGKEGDKKLRHSGEVAHGSNRDRERPDTRTATKSDEIVEKAIELINEAYGEMKKGAVIVSEHATGKGKPFCSNCGRNNAKEDAKALEGKPADQTRMVSGTGGGKKPNCPSCGHRPDKKAADGGTSTTSSEGGFNHVYSDVHEAKRQKQNQ